MKKLSVIALVLALLMCLSAFSACGKDDDKAPKGMVLASSEHVDYRMYVPENWKVDKSDLYTSAYFTTGADATSISVTAYGVSGNEAKVDDWWKGFEEEIKAVYADMSKVKKSDAVLGGVEGKEYSFSAKLADQEYNFIITAVVRNYYVYYITYTSTPEYYEKHLEERTQVIEAFEFDK